MPITDQELLFLKDASAQCVPNHDPHLIQLVQANNGPEPEVSTVETPTPPTRHFFVPHASSSQKQGQFSCSGSNHLAAHTHCHKELWAKAAVKVLDLYT